MKLTKKEKLIRFLKKENIDFEENIISNSDEVDIIIIESFKRNQ